MKAFIRTLSIKERKGYMDTIIYSVFFGLHILITKFILYKLKLNYITLLSLSGSLLILMSFYRIFRSIKKYNALEKEKLSEFNFLEGIYSFITYGGLLASLNWTSLTNVVLITNIFCFFIIFIPLLGSEQAPGILLCLISVIFKFISNKYQKKTKGIKIDMLILNIGFYSAYFGGILMVIFYNKMEHIGTFLWLLIILNAFTTYIMKIFLNKLINNNLNYTKLLVFNLMALLIALPIDLILFNEHFSYFYILLFLLSIDIFFFYKNVIKTKDNDSA